MRYLCLAGLLLSGLVHAGDEEHVRMKIEVNDDSGNVVSLDSESMDFDMTEMQVGENRSFTDDEGRNILVTRIDSGFTLDVDGKIIELPNLSGAIELHEEAVVEGAIADEIADAVVVHRSVAVDTIDDSVLLLSAEKIDAQTQQAIRDALAAGGYANDVKFIESGGHGKKREVRVLKTSDMTEQ